MFKDGPFWVKDFEDLMHGPDQARAKLRLLSYGLVNTDMAMLALRCDGKG